MNFNKTIRRFAALFLVLASVLTLAACTSSVTYPVGDLDDTVYASVGDFSITEAELYDQLRLQGADTLADMIEKTIFESEIVDARALLASGDEDTVNYFTDLVNEAIFGDSSTTGYDVDTTDLEALQEFYSDQHDLYVRAIEIYADSFYLSDNSVDVDALIDELLALGDSFAGYEDISLLVDNYILSVAERNYAKQLLAEEVVDEDSDYYIEESDVVSYYQSQEDGKYDVEALIVRFLNLNEANAALYEVGIKSDSKGNWYQIPDIRITDENDPNYIDLTDTTNYQYIIDMLDELDLLDKLGVDYLERDNLSNDDYQSYYNAYVISNSREDGVRDTSFLLSTAEVKEKFVELYNLLNPTATIKVDENGNVVGDSDTEYSPLYTYDELTDLDTTLRSHIYNTLTAEALMDDPEDTSDDTPFSSRVQTGSTYRFLVFKLDDDSELQDEILVEDPDDEDNEIFGDSAAAQAKYEEMLEELIDSKLTDTYITNKVTEAYEDVSIDIYDPVIRIIYSQSFDYDGTEKTQSGDVVAKVNDTEITVAALYERLERAYGINLSYDLLVNAYLSASDEYTVDDETIEDYEEQFETIISSFTADSYSPTYPASMGRQAFLLVAFGAETNAEAINQLYVYPDLRQQYIDDIEAHYADSDETIYEKFAELTQKQYEYQKGINVSHLLVYVDQDADGSPDDPEEYLNSLTATARTEVENGVIELVDYVYDLIGDYKSYSSGLSTVASNYDSAIRIERGRYDETPYEVIDEDKWVEFRQLGLNLTFESISSEITNTSNMISSSSILDDVFYDRAISLYDSLYDIKDDDGVLPYLDLYDEFTYDGITDIDQLDVVRSSFGWHFILVTSISDKTSAMLYEADDTDGDYVETLDDDTTVNLYNESSDYLTANQIEYYLKSLDAEEAFDFDSDVETALSTYLTPVLSLYQGTYMQRELIFRLLEDITFADSNGADRVDMIRAINRRQLTSYQLSELGGVYDENYANLYGDLFTILEG